LLDARTVALADESRRAAAFFKRATQGD